jgi:hypothetical protein
MNPNQITVPVLDVENSIAFYEMPGLKLIEKHSAICRCPEGNSTFSLHQVENLRGGEGVWIYLSKEFRRIHYSNFKKGIKVEELPNDKPWLWREQD